MSDPYKRDQLAAREIAAKAMGGEDKLARQEAKGRMHVRDRIDTLLDDDSFQEIGLLTHSDIPAAAKRSPADGKVCGWGKVEDRTVLVCGDDVTVFAGAGGRNGYAKAKRLMEQAAVKGYPIVNLGDAGGARVPDIMGSVGMMSMTIRAEAGRNRRVPMVSAIMGECYGGPTWLASISDIIVQVKGTVMSVGAPTILEVATGENPDPQDLGGWKLHAETTGMVDLFAEDEAHCLELIRKVLDYFPSSAEALPPRRPTGEKKDAKVPAIMDLVPAERTTAYDMRAVLALLADPGTLIELKQFYDPSLIIALARLDGYVVGFLANNPRYSAGAMGPGACEKATAFIALCDSFHMPLIFLHDTPGFLVGRAAEERKFALKIMNFIEALGKCSVPRISLIMRKSYGMAHCNMSGGNMDSDMLLAWPTAEISFMAPEVALNVVHGRKTHRADNPEAFRREAMDALTRGSEPWDAAGQGLIDKIIRPEDTRAELISALERARGSSGKAGKSKRLLSNWPARF